MLAWLIALVAAGTERGDILLEEHFESWRPAGWVVIDNTGGGCEWSSTDWIGRPNYAGGDGAAAVADSDVFYSDNVDTELRTPPLDLTGIPAAVLSFVSAYKDIDPAPGTDHADVDISVNGGITWIQLMSWNEPHDPEGPGELVRLSLDPYVGYSNVIIRFRYVSGWDWWWQIDDVTIIETVPGMPDPPEDFSAWTLSDSEIELTWLTNTMGDLVMIATNGIPEFGMPVSHYTVGDTIAGGGGIVYIGSDTNFVLSGLPGNTRYYFRAWATNNVTYSLGTDADARTFPVTTATYPYFESFEDGFGQWAQPEDPELAWRRQTGSTPYSSTGPTGAYDGVWYLYTPVYWTAGITAQLDGSFDFSSLRHPEFSFYYHMFGESMGSLAIDIFDGQWHENTWLRTGEQQNSASAPWKQAVLDLTPYAGAPFIVLRFRSISGGNYTGDCAMDAVGVRELPAGLYLDPPLQHSEGNPDTILTKPLVIKNYTDSNQVCMLSYTGSGWDTTGLVSVSIQPHAVVTSDVSVTIPTDVLAGDQATSLVTAVTADGMYTNSAVIITRCTWTYNIMKETLDTDPGWHTQGEWEFGQPTGQGNYMTDPLSGYSGPYVYGYNLQGDYTDNMPVYYLTTPAFDCSGEYNLSLEFQRWLSVENCCDHATIEISNNGITWHEIWDGYGNDVYESFWRKCSYDISAFADDQSSVYIRWGMGPSDSSVTYPGWNLDDIAIVRYRTDIDNTILEAHDPVILYCYEYTPSLRASVYREGETGTGGPAAHISAEFGYGRYGTLPTQDWTWIPAVFAETGSTSDFYEAQVQITMAGELSWGFRFRKGEAVWTYADLDSSANGLSIGQFGRITALVPALSGESIRNQILPDKQWDVLPSYHSEHPRVPVDIAACDDVKLSSDTFIHGIRWLGAYNEAGRTGRETGFMLNIHGKNSVNPQEPGPILHSEFHAGYACENPTGQYEYIYEYCLDLETPFLMHAGSTYWVSVQMDAGSNATEWGILGSDDQEFGQPAVILWDGNTWIVESDMGFELRGSYTNNSVICGRVTAAHSGLPVPGVAVTLESGAYHWQTVTGTDGWYFVPLPYNVYTLNVEKELYVPQQYKGIVMHTPGLTNRIDIVLDGSTLECTPDTLELTAYKDTVLTNTVVLKNTGPLAIDFSLYLDDLALTADGSILSGTRAPDVALCGSDGNSRLDDVYDKLRGSGRLNTVTLFDVGDETPTLATLTNYDALLVYQYYSYYDSYELGNMIHDYAEQGGGVVTMIEEVGYGNMYGRWYTSEYVIADYTGINYYYQPRLGTIHNPQHPLMGGVTTLEYNDSGMQPLLRELQPETELIADWDSGNPLVIAKEYLHTRRVDLGFYPVSDDASWRGWDSSTDGDTLMANGLIWSAHIPPGWISISTNSGTLQPGESMQVEIIMDAGELSEFALYGTHLYINGSFANELHPVQLLLRHTGDPVISTLSSIKFGEVEIDDSKTYAMTVRNTGDGILTGEVYNITAPFGISGNSTYALAADEKETLYVYFAPDEEGVYTNIILLTGGGDAEVLLTGTGIPEPVTFIYMLGLFSAILKRTGKLQ
jgi:hypothetical protein